MTSVNLLLSLHISSSLKFKKRAYGVLGFWGFGVIVILELIVMK